MLWIFLLALIMPIKLGDATACGNGSCGHGESHVENSPKNLAVITWAHAVNSKDSLKTTLENGELHFEIIK